MAATEAVTALEALSSDVPLTMSSTIVAAGATVCTISVSRTSSPLASQGEAEGASVVTERRCAEGRWNNSSNSARSARMSLVGSGNCGSASSGSTTVSPRPSMPRASRGATP
jgi:hypothetical protein